MMHFFIKKCFIFIIKSLHFVPNDRNNNKESTVQVMAWPVWWRQATSHYMKQRWATYFVYYGIIR